MRKFLPVIVIVGLLIIGFMWYMGIKNGALGVNQKSIKNGKCRNFLPKKK